ncbi:post-GPI attachment to proteins factor 6-like isoform X2 [Gigantopelta aegis]|uniref:post-GPI attachment to proteins factor 6-like isoform X2 n=1 Tax=Gigantopelta aegis TaxID=1735272 RepID=UPI001B88C797|nr:post-GPI attachment to proteins factor 6-like isoform X2 [Gigantopelta aegis]
MTFLISITILCVLLQNIIRNTVHADTLYTGEVQWSVAENVHPYSEYKDVSLLSVYVPPNTERLLLLFRGASDPTSCGLKNITVYVQHGGFPVINPYNESFPDDFHLKRSSLKQFDVPSDNVTIRGVIAGPQPGTWYAAGFMRKFGNTHLSQKGFSKQCAYALTVVAVNQVVDEVWDLAIEDSQTVYLGTNTERLFRFQVPDDVVTYDFTVDKCVVHTVNKTTVLSPCPLYLTLSEGSLQSEGSYHLNCSEHNITTCHLEVGSPPIGKWSFLKLVRDLHVENLQEFSFRIKFTSYECDKPELLTHIEFNNSTHLNLTAYTSNTHNTAACIIASALGKFTFESILFTSAFLFHNFDLRPSPENELFVPDEFTMTTSFRIMNAEDTGGTLELGLTFLDVGMFQGTAVWMCLMKDRIPYKAFLKTCTNGVLLKVNSSDNQTDVAYIPYPEAGVWYIAFKSVCFNPKHIENVENCNKTPAVRFSVTLAPCFRKCGSYGKCSQFISGIYVFTTCECYAGWRGYGCTDGSQANSLTIELLSTLLLTFSNLFFIPGIYLAVRRHFYVEAVAFLFNMFFSTFYHACDSSEIYQFCIMKYDTLGFSDFLGSFLSFWMVLLAMAKIPHKVRQGLHMFGVLMIAVFMNYDRHGSWETIVPLCVGGIITAGSWIFRIIRFRTLFPSKKRWLKFLLPGFLLSITGVVVFSAVETEENYMYTHSFWHMTITLSIVFLLPPRKSQTKELKIQTVSSCPSSEMLDPADSSEQNLIT